MKLMQTATIIARHEIVSNLFLFAKGCGLIFSDSNVGVNETDIGIPLFKIFFLSM